MAEENALLPEAGEKKYSSLFDELRDTGSLSGLEEAGTPASEEPSSFVGQLMAPRSEAEPPSLFDKARYEVGLAGNAQLRAEEREEVAETLFPSDAEAPDFTERIMQEPGVKKEGFFGGYTIARPAVGPSLFPKFITGAGREPGRSIYESEEDYISRRQEELSRDWEFQQTQKRLAKIEDLALEDLAEVFPDKIETKLDPAHIDHLPPDQRPQAIADFDEVQEIYNEDGMPKRRKISALVNYTNKYHPEFRELLDDEFRPRYDATLSGQPLGQDPTKFGGGYGWSLMGAMWFIDKGARRMRAAVLTEYEHKKNRILDPENTPHTLSKEQFDERFKENWKKATWEADVGNEVAKAQYVLNRLPGLGGSGIGLSFLDDMLPVRAGELAGDLVDVATYLPRNMILKGGVLNAGSDEEEEARAMRLKASESKEEMAKYIDFLEKEFDERNEQAAQYWTGFGYKVGSVLPEWLTGATKEQWLASRERAWDQGSRGGREFVGTVNSAILDPLNFPGATVKAIALPAKFGITMTRKGAQAVGSEVAKRTAQYLQDINSKLQKGENAWSPEKARSMAVQQANESVAADVIAATDTAFRNGRIGVYGIDQAVQLRQMMDNSAGGVAEAVQDYIKTNNIPLNTVNAGPLQGEALWVYLMKESKKKKQLFSFEAAMVGADAAGKPKWVGKVKWSDPPKAPKQSKNAAYEATKVVSSTDALRSRFGYWATGTIIPLRADKARRRASSIFNIDKAQPYVTGLKSEARKLSQDEVLHPARFKQVERLDMQNARKRAVDTARVAEFLRRIDAITDDKEVQQLALQLAELGRHMPLSEEAIEGFAKLTNVEQIVSRALDGDLSDIPQSLLDDLNAAAEFANIGDSLMTLSRELEATRGLADDTVVMDVAGNPLPAKEARKKLLADATNNIRMIRTALADTLGETFRREAMLGAFEQTGAIVDRIAMLREARDGLQELVKNKVWNQSENLDEALKNLELVRLSMGETLDEIYLPQGPSAEWTKNPESAVKNAQAAGRLPAGDLSQWKATQRAFNESVESLSFKSPDKFSPPQVKAIKEMYRLAAEAWAFNQGVPKEYAPAYFTEMNIQVRAQDPGAPAEAGALRQLNPFNPNDSTRFYSVLLNALREAPNFKTVGEFKDFLSGKQAQKLGVKQEEIADSIIPGLDDYQSITKDELIELVEANTRPWSVRVESTPDVSVDLSSLSEEARRGIFAGLRAPQETTPDFVRGEWPRMTKIVKAQREYDPVYFMSEGATPRRFDEGFLYPNEVRVTKLDEEPHVFNPIDDGFVEVNDLVTVGADDALTDFFRSNFWKELVEGGDVPDEFGNFPAVYIDGKLLTVEESVNVLDDYGLTSTALFDYFADSMRPRITIIDSRHPVGELVIDTGHFDRPNRVGVLESLNTLDESYDALVSAREKGLGQKPEQGIRVWVEGKSASGEPAVYESYIPADRAPLLGSNKELLDSQSAYIELGKIADSFPEDQTLRGNADAGHFANKYDPGYVSPETNPGTPGYIRGLPGKEYTEMTFSVDDLLPGEVSVDKATGLYHYGEEIVKKYEYSPNIFLHVRFDTVIDPDTGEKLLRILEIQSDAHGTAKKAGYQRSEEQIARAPFLFDPDDAAEIIQKASYIDPVDGVRIPVVESLNDAAYAAKLTPSVAADVEGILAEEVSNFINGKNRSIDSAFPEERLRRFVEENAGPDSFPFIQGEYIEDLRFLWPQIVESSSKAIRLGSTSLEKTPVPNVPYKKSWQKLATRSLVDHAVKNNFDGILWEGGRRRAKSGRMTKKPAKVLYDEKIRKELVRTLGSDTKVKFIDYEDDPMAMRASKIASDSPEDLYRLTKKFNEFLRRPFASDAQPPRSLFSSPEVEEIWKKAKSAKTTDDLLELASQFPNKFGAKDLGAVYEFSQSGVDKGRYSGLAKAMERGPGDSGEMLAGDFVPLRRAGENLKKAFASKNYRKIRSAYNRYKAIENKLSHAPYGTGRIYKDEIDTFLLGILDSSNLGTREYPVDKASIRLADDVKRRALFRRDDMQRLMSVAELRGDEAVEWSVVDSFIPPSNQESYVSRLIKKAKDTVEGRPYRADFYKVSMSDAQKSKIREEGVPKYALDAKQDGYDVLGTFLHDSKDGARIIEIMQKGDFTTFIHETGHLFRTTLSKRDQEIANEWARRNFGDKAFAKDGQWNTIAEEAFANAFVQYMKTGEFPDIVNRSAGIKKIFVQFKDWVKTLYYAYYKKGRSIKGAVLLPTDGSPLPVDYSTKNLQKLAKKHQKKKYTAEQIEKMSDAQKMQILRDAGVETFTVSDDIKGVLDRIFDPRALEESPLSVEVRTAQRAYELSDPVSRLFSGAAYRNSIQRLMKSVGYTNEEIAKTVKMALSESATTKSVALQTLQEASNKAAGRYHSPQRLRRFKAPTPSEFKKGRGGVAQFKKLLIRDIVRNTLLGEDDVASLVNEIFKLYRGSELTKFMGLKPASRSEQWRQWIEEVAATFNSRNADQQGVVIPKISAKGVDPEDVRYIQAMDPELPNSVWDKARTGTARDELKLKKLTEELAERTGLEPEVRGKSIKQLISARDFTAVKRWMLEAKSKLEELAQAKVAAEDTLEVANEISSKKKKITARQQKKAAKTLEWIDGAISDLEDIVRKELILARRQGKKFGSAAAYDELPALRDMDIGGGTGVASEDALSDALSTASRALTGVEPRAKATLPKKGSVRAQAGKIKRKIQALEKKAAPLQPSSLERRNIEDEIKRLRQSERDLELKIAPVKEADRLTKILEQYPEFSKELMATAKLLNYDFRTPGQVWREVISLRKEARAYGDYAELQKQVAVDTFKKSQAADILREMTSDEIQKIMRLIKDPNKRLYGVGKNASPEAKRIAAKLGLVGTEDLRLGLKAGKRRKEAGRSRVGAAFSKDEIEQALQVAELVDDFLGEQLKRMQAAGKLVKTVDPKVLKEIQNLRKQANELDEGTSAREILEERITYLRENKLEKPWGKEEFLSRVNLAAYVPHILSTTTRRKVAVLRGRGLMPKDAKLGSEKFRAKASFLEDINEVARDDLATEILYHIASTKRGPGWGDNGPFQRFVSVQQLDELSAAVNSNDLEKLFSPEEWSEAIKWARKEADLNEIYDFFETDLGTLIKRYGQQTNKAVADAIFIRDMQDLFPLGKEIARLVAENPASWSEMKAKEYGYSRLTAEDTIAATARMELPSELRKFKELIVTRLARGEDPGLIVRSLRQLGVNVDANVVRAFNLPDVYLPTAAVEYIRWMNSPDPASGSYFMGVFDGLTGVAKSQATIVGLAHIGMNFAGNYLSILQQLGLGSFNPVNHMLAMGLMMDYSSKGWQLVKDKPLRLGGRVETVADWRRILEEETAITESLRGSAYAEEMYGAARETDVPLYQSLIGGGVGGGLGAAAGMAAAGPAGAAAGFFLGQAAGALGTEVLSSGLRRGRSIPKGVATGFRKVWQSEVSEFMENAAIPIGKDKENPKNFIMYWGERAVGLTTSAAIASTFGGPTAAVTTAIAGMSFPSYMRMMANLNSSIELQARLTLGVGLMRKGKTVQEASTLVDDAMRNYGHLTPFERHYLRRFFFFYTWDAGNMRFQLRQMVRNPRSFVVLKSFINGVGNGQFTEEEIQAMPQEMRWQVVVRTGLGRMFRVHGIPQQAAIEFLARKDHGFMPIGSLTRMNPIPLTMAEAAFNKSLYYGKGWEQINNIRAYKDAPPLLKWFIGMEVDDDGKAVPTSRRKVYNKDGEWTGKWRNEYRSKKPAQFYLVSKLPGFRVMREHMKLVQDTFMSRSVDMGDTDALATDRERALAYFLGLKPTALDFDSALAMYEYLMLKRLKEIYRNQGIPIDVQMDRLKKELYVGGEEAMKVSPKKEDSDELPSLFYIPDDK